MELLDGLFLYEILMLALGVVLFVTLIIAFAILVIQGRPYSKLLSFFVLPIIMIGYPSIASLEISSSMLKIDKYARGIEGDPADSRLRNMLADNLENVSGRVFGNSEATIKIARAELALGQKTAAEEKLKKVIAKSPRLPAALELKKRIEIDRRIAVLADHVEQNPDDNVAKSRLAATVSKAEGMEIASPDAIANVARAQTILGDNEKAKANVEMVLTIDPRHDSARLLDEKLGELMRN